MRVVIKADRLAWITVEGNDVTLRIEFPAKEGTVPLAHPVHNRALVWPGVSLIIEDELCISDTP